MVRAKERSTELAHIVDALVPGDEAFPSASAAGVHVKLEERALAVVGPRFIEALLARLSAAIAEGRLIGALADFEREQPADFELMVGMVYFAYYENLEVKEAIRNLGYVYNDRPQPQGHPLAPFDPSNRLEKPNHSRGSYVPTDAVRRVDLQPLGDLTVRVG